MAADVTVYILPGHHRSEKVCRAMAEGIAKTGDSVQITTVHRYMKPTSRVAVFYGLAQRLDAVLRDYAASPDHTAVYIDLGYWGRKTGGRFNGYHKLSIDGRHPTAYFQGKPHDESRIAPFRLDFQPWRKAGSHILLAGMGPKGARAEGYNPLGWERWAVQQIRKVSDRPIIYRPKPNWSNAPRLDGLRVEHRAGTETDLPSVLADCHAVVSHHSNTGVDAILAGVPNFSIAGVATAMGLTDLAQIEAPLMPGPRRQWAADIGWVQWSVEEMERGAPWMHLKDEGLIP